MSLGLDMNEVVGTHDLLFVVLDTLRHDVADTLWREGRTPHFARLLPPTGWEQRHAPGNFTFASHQAFFAGFLPTPARPGQHPRLFALRFEGSETTAPTTCVLDGPNIVAGLERRGYHTLCVGGVGFFNQRNPLGQVLPGMFAERHWRPETGVTDPRSTEHQIAIVEDSLARLRADRRAFVFLNVSALHQPNHFYLPGAHGDSLATHAAALEYVDRQLPRLIAAVRRGAPVFAIFCSDHGTCYGEDGFVGHRVSHPAVMTVPYAEMLL